MYFGFPLSVDNLLLVDSPGVSSSVPSPRNSLRPFSPDQKFGKTATPLVNHPSDHPRSPPPSAPLAGARRS